MRAVAIVVLAVTVWILPGDLLVDLDGLLLSTLGSGC